MTSRGNNSVSSPIFVRPPREERRSTRRLTKDETADDNESCLQPTLVQQDPRVAQLMWLEEQVSMTSPASQRPPDPVTQKEKNAMDALSNARQPLASRRSTRRMTKDETSYDHESCIQPSTPPEKRQQDPRWSSFASQRPPDPPRTEEKRKRRDSFFTAADGVDSLQQSTPGPAPSPPFVPIIDETPSTVDSLDAIASSAPYVRTPSPTLAKDDTNLIMAISFRLHWRWWLALIVSAVLVLVALLRWHARIIIGLSTGAIDSQDPHTPPAFISARLHPRLWVSSVQHPRVKDVMEIAAVLGVGAASVPALAGPIALMLLRMGAHLPAALAARTATSAAASAGRRVLFAAVTRRAPVGLALNLAQKLHRGLRAGQVVNVAAKGAPALRQLLRRAHAWWDHPLFRVTVPDIMLEWQTRSGVAKSMALRRP